jgi:hypothetical protein
MNLIENVLLGTLERVLIAHPATKDLPQVALTSLVTELAKELTTDAQKPNV